MLGGYGVVWISIVGKLIQSERGQERIPYLLSFNIVSMGFLTTFLSVVLNWGGECIDVLG